VTPVPGNLPGQGETGHRPVGGVRPRPERAHHRHHEENTEMTEDEYTEDLTRQVVDQAMHMESSAQANAVEWRKVAEQLHQLIVNLPVVAQPFYLDSEGERREETLLVGEGVDPYTLREHLATAMGIADQYAAAIPRTAATAHQKAVQTLIELKGEQADQAE
jgi:hypothetical protein